MKKARITITARIPAALSKQFKIIARSQKRSMSAMLELLIENEVGRNKDASAS